MNKIETLPKFIEYNGETYAIEMHVTAWDKLCLCYKKEFPSKTTIDEHLLIFPQVIENHTTIAAQSVEDITEVTSLDAAAYTMELRLKNALYEGKVSICKREK